VQGHTKNIFLRERDPDDRRNPDVDFDDRASQANMDCDGKLNYQQMIDLDGTGPLEILCMQEGVFPLGAFDYSTFPFTNVTNSLPTVSHVNDTAVADLDGDLLTDMVMTRGAIRPSGATLVNSNRIESWLRKDDEVAAGKGFTFESPGAITVTIDHKGMGIYSAAEVWNLDPETNPTETLITIEESPEGSLVGEWDAVQNVWRFSIIEVEKSFQVYLRIDTVEPVTNLTEVAFDVPETAWETMHLQNGPTGLKPIYTSGLYTPVYCVSVVTGDFDNDMDQDVYLVCRRGADNLSNRLYINQGDGTFVEQTAHGAEGAVGTGITIGVGESVVTADYDVDGFLDLYVTNGLLYYPINVGGPEQLFRNTGNSNHWLELDLQGTTSNRDGVGAKVLITAGGVTQLREQNGGIHRWSQNDPRMHVGLADNTTADITITWPSGTVDTFTNVAADALYVAIETSTTEAGSIAPAVMGPPVYTQMQPGNECGQPAYNLDYGPVMQLWKDCAGGSNVWQLRMRGGRATELQYSEGRILGDGPFAGIVPIELIATDTLNNTVPGIIEFNIGSWFTNNKGFNFSTEGQSQSCLSFGVRDIPTLIVGAGGKKWTGGLDLVNLTACDAPAPPPDLPECGEPSIDNFTENGLFAWRDCDLLSTSVARWNFILAAGGAAFTDYNGMITSDSILSAVGNGLEANDVLDTLPGDTTIDFTLRVGGSGIDGFQVDVPLSSTSCLEADTLPAGTAVLVGEDKLPQTGNFDLVTLDACADVGCHP